MKKRLQKISSLLDNVADAFRGEYVSRDKNGTSYKDLYENAHYSMGKEGAQQDAKNLARDMSAALKKYGQAKKTITG